MMAAFDILTSLYGLGLPSIPKPLAFRALEYNALGEIFYILAIALAKSAIGLALLRIAVHRRHRTAAWTLLITCNAAYVGSLIFLLVACRPYAANWNLELGTCAGNKFLPVLTDIVSVFAAVTDAGYVVLPIDMIRSLQMAPRLRYTLMAVMALGSSAAIFALVRIPWSRFLPATYENTGESSLHVLICIYTICMCNKAFYSSMANHYHHSVSREHLVPYILHYGSDSGAGIWMCACHW